MDKKCNNIDWQAVDFAMKKTGLGNNHSKSPAPRMAEEKKSVYERHRDYLLTSWVFKIPVSIFEMGKN